MATTPAPRRKRRRWLLLAVPVALAVGVAVWRFWPEAEPPGTGAEFFHGGVPGASPETGLPYALARAMMRRYPEILGRNRAEFRRRFGLLADQDSAEGLPVGFALTRAGRGGAEMLVTTFALCHVGEIDGRRIVGLGNRDLDLVALQRALLRIVADPGFNEESMLPAIEAVDPDAGRHARVIGQSIQALKNIAVEDDRQWPSLLNLDPGSGRTAPLVFARRAVGIRFGLTTGPVKIPALWMYRRRQTFGCDGCVSGDRALALASVEFLKGMSPQDILRHPGRWNKLLAYVESIKPPAFPGRIDRKMAQRGRGLYERHCARCHADGETETLTPLEEVGTDAERLAAVTEEMARAGRLQPLASRVQLRPSRGYIAPSLAGVWSRAPYLHNGGVPTLDDLLRPPQERPAAFHVGGGTRYDLERVGLMYEEERGRDGKRRGKRANQRQWRFDTAERGNGAAGHEFGTMLEAVARRALVEYLKTL